MERKDRAWSSGRVLTATQRERKRAVDRERSSRLRKQATTRIHGLESKIKALEKANEFEAGRIDASSTPVGCGSDTESINPQWHSSGDTDLFADGSTNTNCNESSNCQSIFNEALLAACSLSPSEVCTDPSRNEDSIVRGVVQGWDEVVAQHAFFCPLWRILRFLDSRIFRLSGTMTRFCTLSMIHHMLLCFVKASELGSLPSWYRPRPTQKSIAHPLAVDILPWPGLRERAVLDPHLTLSNRFWNDVIYCFRFYWPYDEADAVKIDPGSKLLGFTGKFQNSVREIHKWTMDETFFAAFPETFDDIVPAPRLEWPLSENWPEENYIASFVYSLPLPDDGEESVLEALKLGEFGMELSSTVTFNSDPIS